MSNKVFQQNLDDKKGSQPGGPYLIQMLFKEPVEMPDKEKMTAIMEKIRRCIRATSARRSCGCSRPTPWSGAATATSTATPSNGGWRAGGMGRTSP